MGKLRFLVALYAAKLVAMGINIIAKGRGTNKPGAIALKIDPQFIEHVKGVDPEKTLFITGTNGKSTSTNLIGHVLLKENVSLAINLAGANLLGGVAVTLLNNCTLTGKLNKEYIVLEIDERSLPIIHKHLPAKNIMITNLQKDQVQRNGDPDFIYRKLAPIMKDNNIRLFLNGDEPRSLSFMHYNDNVVTFGIERNSETFVKPDSFPGMACPICHDALRFSEFNSDGIGKFKCAGCDHESVNNPDYIAKALDFENRKFTIDGIECDMPYDQPFMCYNYAAAAAVAKEFLGIPVEKSTRHFSTFKNIGGRFETIEYKGKTIKYMRIKQENPDTLQSTINVMAKDPESKMVCLGLGAILDITPYYSNTFYAWDCDLSRLVTGNVEKYFCFSDTVCYDIKNWLLYSGVPEEKITVIETDDIDVIFGEMEKVETDNIYMITKLDTFELMQQKAKEV